MTYLFGTTTSVSTPTMNLGTTFETSTRFGGGANGTGSARTFDSNGLTLSTGNSALGYSHNTFVFPSLGQATAETGSPSFSTHIAFYPGTNVQFFFGIGNPPDWTGSPTQTTYIQKHIGFRITRAASGAINLVASQADGATETTSTITTLTSGDYLDLIVKVNSTTSVDYYYRKNGGALSSATNLTTNMPTGVTGSIFHFISNVGNTSNSDAYMASMSYTR